MEPLTATTIKEKRTNNILDRFTVHGLFYWMFILIFIILGISRFGYIIYTWYYYTPIRMALPKEVYFWLLMFATFPVGIHIVAGFAEVQLNRRRKRSYGDKII
jgi:hypothetical protein